MAIAPVVNQRVELGDTEVLYIGTLTVTGTYTTAGEAVDIVGNERINVMLCPNQGGYMTAWDAAAQKLLFYQGDNANAGVAPGVQVANATSLVALNGMTFVAIGQ